MRTANINYQELLNGKYKRVREFGPFADYDRARGARVMSNVFGDLDLVLKESSPFTLNLHLLIGSARRQEFERVLVSNFGNKVLDMRNLKVLEQISLSEVTINNKGISIVLLDNVAYEREIWPYKSMTKLHPNYKTPEEIKELQQELVPKVPSHEKIMSILAENQPSCGIN